MAAIFIIFIIGIVAVAEVIGNPANKAITTSSNGGTQVSVSTTGSCTSLVQNLNIYTYSVNNLITPPTPQQVNTKFSIFSPLVQNGEVAAYSGNTATTGPLVWPATSSGTGCYKTFTVVAGTTNLAYYLQLQTINTTTTSTPTVSFTLYNYTGVTAQVGNTIRATPTANAVIRNLVFSTSQALQAQIYVNGSSGWFGAGPTGQFVAIYSYNSQATSAPVPAIPYTLYTGKLPSTGYVTGQNNQVAYVFPSLTKSQWLGGSSAGFSLNIGTLSSIAANTVIGMDLVPVTTYLNTSTGQPIYGQIVYLNNGTAIAPSVNNPNFIGLTIS